MRKLTLALALTAAMALPTTAAVAGNGNGNAPGHAEPEGTVRGVAADPNAPILGDVEYLFNKAGFHLWFTATATAGNYMDGHSYHNVYKYSVDDPANWCGTTTVQDRLPYNAGGTAGQIAYYKIWDVTTESWVCGSDG